MGLTFLASALMMALTVACAGGGPNADGDPFEGDNAPDEAERGPVPPFNGSGGSGTTSPSTPTSVPSGCCRTCTQGKACGDSCINRQLTCRVGSGCACNG